MRASLILPPEASLISGDNPVYIGNINRGQSRIVNWTIVFKSSGVFNIDVRVFGFRADNYEPVERTRSTTVTVIRMTKVLSPENTTYTNGSIPLTFTLCEPASWIGFSLDGQANITITKNTTLIGLPDGTHNILIYANHTFGTIASNKVYFTIDTTPPVISILYPQNTTYHTNLVSLNFTVNETTDWMGYSLDRQGNVTILGNTTLIGLSDGPHCVEVYANDTYGYMASADIIYFTVDTTPIISIVIEPIISIVNEPLYFNASASYAPETQVVSFEWDFGDGTTGTGVTTDHIYMVPGNYTVILSIKDEAGNTATKKIIVTVQEQSSIFPPWLPAVIVLVAVAVGLLLIYSLKLRKQHSVQ